MKRLCCGVGFVLAISVLSASPAAACFTCRDSGLICGTYGCIETYTCDYTTDFCSSCYEDCWEDTEGGYCHLSTFCLFAALPSGAAERVSLMVPSPVRRARICAS
jgi:hypothetical protein